MIKYEDLRKFNQVFWASYQERFTEILESGWFILGEQLKAFEKAYASYCGTSYCIGISSGLDALKLAIHALDFEEGSEIIVPGHTFIATFLAIHHCRLKPILVDPDIHTYNLNPSHIEQKISPKTVAILPVHMHGKCCPMAEIQSLAQQYQLKIIEDASQAHGACLENKKAGSFGDIAACSFYPTKNLGALGDAGAVTTSDQSLAQKIFSLRNYGAVRKDEYHLPGFNQRMDELQAAFLSVKLQHLDTINQHKRKLANIYLENLKDDFVKPVLEQKAQDVYYIFNIRHPDRDRVREYLTKQGVQTLIHYPIPVSHQPSFKNILGDQSIPITEEICRTTLSLPISYIHHPDEIYKIVEILNKY